MFVDLVGNLSFTLTISNCKRSRLRWSILAPLLFNINTWLANHHLTKYAYFDDLAIIDTDGDGQAVKGVLSKDMASIGKFLQTWKLKLDTTKTVLADFHLNKEAKCELKVNHNNETLAFCSESKNLRETFDRILTYRQHLESLGKSWHHMSHSWGSSLARAGVLEQQRCEQAPTFLK